MLKLSEATAFKYLSNGPIKISGIDDAEDHLQLRQAFTSMNFTKDEEESIFRIVAGILHIGNLEFVEAGVEAAAIKDKEVLGTAADVLFCSVELLEKCILYKRRVTGNEKFESPNDPQKARNARDAVAKFLYSRLFELLIQRCNEALGAELGTSKAALFLGVLDIAGFEVFETNMLEQLFINFSNEKLQHFFNNTVFKKELFAGPYEQVKYFRA
jgi:myosin heavy subunit